MKKQDHTRPEIRRKDDLKKTSSCCRNVTEEEEEKEEEAEEEDETSRNIFHYLNIHVKIGEKYYLAEEERSG